MRNENEFYHEGGEKEVRLDSNVCRMPTALTIEGRVRESQ